MELQEFIAEKIKFEEHLMTAISNLTEKFKEKTGFSPSSISVSMTPTATIGVIGTQYIVNRVTVDIDL